MITTIQFYLDSKTCDAIWCEAEINIIMDQLDGKDSVFWDEDINTINVDRINRETELSILKLRPINQDRITEAIKEKVSNLTEYDFRRIKNDNYENYIGV
jgi:hypothetical protein